MSAPKQLRARNVATVVDALRAHGGISRTELAHATGLSRTTVVSILEQLEDGGYITIRRGDGSPPGVIGRPAATIALNPSAGVVLGICASREHIGVVLTDLSLRVLADRRARFAFGTPAERVIDILSELAEDALGAAQMTSDIVVGAVLGLPSPVEPETGQVDPDVLETWAGRPVRDMVSARLRAPVAIENDANLEALGELAAGAGRGVRDAIYLHVGWGLGGAVILDGRLRRGRSGAAGELAHIRVRHAGGPPCQCGRRGCLKSVASGYALARVLAAAHGTLDGDELVDLIRQGEPGVRRAVTDAGREIGSVLAGLCTSLNPQSVIVGGRLAAEGSPLVDAVRRQIEEDLLPAAGPVDVVAAALGELAGPLGAAALVARSGDLAAPHAAFV